MLTRFALILAVFVFTFQSIAQVQPADRFWQPVQDEVYLQESVHKVASEQSITGVAVQGEACYVIINNRIYRLNEEQFLVEKNSPEEVNRLISIDGKLWALSANGIYMLDQNKWKNVDDRSYVDMCIHLGEVHAATREEIFKWQGSKFNSIKPEGGYYNSDITMLMEDGTQLHADPVRLGPIDRIA